MFTPEEQQVIAHAAAIFESKIKTCDAFSSPDLVKGFCQNRLATSEREIFMMLILDQQHRLIEAVELFHGTIDAASVYPREVVKSALKHNGAAVILAHNHPSGVTQPSSSDRRITDRIKDALALVDIRTLDHIVVGAEGSYAFSEHGLI
ncbi:RadC family protein [Vibrio vulnificus]|uniref:RadC family protein n=1 Tax=Vibrio vulnificus TaxID=672 RepID=UPI00215C6D3A|nr:DNA repair protein RadC [Vibrio vulnificus]MCR9501883.1 DNA repair protein RadC [Vibrio vulnificus]